MEPIFRYRLLNGWFEDPALYVKILREKRAVQFDLGDIGALTPSEINRITDVFVTHTHMDHFMGFDALLRVILRRDLPLNVYGPPNITACVSGKLKGYAWNLIRDYPTLINVYAYNGKTLTHSAFSARNRFRKETLSCSPSDGTLLKDPLFEVRAAKLHHGIPCLAYAIKEGYHINIDKALLKKKGLAVGPWLSEFKRILREDPAGRRTLEIGGRAYNANRLLDIANITEGQKISYATDIAMSRINLDKLTALVEGSDIFCCEAYYLDKDAELARKRFHLTAKTCGSAARKAGVKKLLLMHFSPKYRNCQELVIQEAMDAFSG
ncbi:MAG: ribonuclease Z [Nitrospirae bacterium]|nr:ribonuclease Z [Nitrospirota bacterium]